jgi:hypothetical protein|tara:strand:- start:221 stop:718 length:498 start_codon:yes stop_codon:yes gene_type:complete
MKTIITLIIALFSIQTAYADYITQQEFTTINRIFNLCKNCGDDLKVLVYYDDQEPRSIKDVKEIIEFAEHNSIYDVTKTTDLETEFSNYNLVLLANRVDYNDMQKIIDKTKGKKVITASTDTQCVEEGACLLGIDVSDSIRIFMNKEVFLDSQVKFNDDLFLLIN